MMKHVFTTAVFFLTAISAFAQDLSKENLMGKWKLESVEYNGEKMPLKKLFNSSEIYQIYKNNNAFESLVGKKSTKGEWELKKDKKRIYITVGKTHQEFRVKSFKKDKMTLFNKNDDFSLILWYKKVD